MTDLDRPRIMDPVHPPSRTDTEPATDMEPSVCATRAAQSAAVEIRETKQLSELGAIADLYAQIWRPTSGPLMNPELLRALSKAGNYVAAAFDRGTLVGACVGFFAAPADSALHSHIAGVSATMAGRHVGYALKLHQRAWALRHGVGLIEWTFDPLVARNAYFNIVKLGGRPAEYLPNFYGGMADGINGGGDTDRLLLHWDLAAPHVVAACAGAPQRVDLAALRADGAAVALGRDGRGGPVVGPTDAQTLLVAVPRDVEKQRLEDPGQAQEWRAAVRGVLGGLLADGARVTGFDRSGHYVVER